MSDNSWHNLTNQQTDFVAQHLKCCYGHSEVPEQSLSSKYFCIIASQNGLPRLCSQTADIHLRKQDICSSALSKYKSFIFIIFDNYYNKWLLLLFFVIFSSSLSGSDDFVISNSLDGNGAYSQMFYAINFAHKLNSQLRMETRLLSKTTYIWWRTYFGPRNDPRTPLLGHASDNTK